MHVTDPENVNAMLARLVGKRLCVAKNAVDMEVFGFGHERAVDVEHTVPEISLHIQCPWRIESKTGVAIVTGSSDFYLRAADNHDGSWKPGRCRQGV